MNPTSEMLDERAVAALTSLKVSRLQKDRVAGGPRSIPFLKLGRLVRYRRADIEKWIREQKAFQSTSEYGGRHAR